MRTRLGQAWRRDQNLCPGDGASGGRKPAKPQLQRRRALSGGRVHETSAASNALQEQARQLAQMAAAFKV